MESSNMAYPPKLADADISANRKPPSPRKALTAMRASLMWRRRTRSSRDHLVLESL